MADLGRDDWMRAARLALLRGGAERVRVEVLARELGVTKGSFYWHFRDREELLDALVREWEVELFEDIIPRLQGRRGPSALRVLVKLMIARVPLSESGHLPSDAALFTWASVSPDVATRVNRAERKRLRVLTDLIGDPRRVELVYLVWLGFVARGQRVPGSRRRFPRIARMIIELLQPEKRPVER
jgi:AcrR family transcriptional regulator